MDTDSDERIKPLRWVGPSRSDVKSFPRAVRSEIGQALYAAQRVETDPAAKPMKGFVYVLHAFQKKSKSGIATPKKEIDLIHKRLADAERDYKKRPN
jgi:phage-related protein